MESGQKEIRVASNDYAEVTARHTRSSGVDLLRGFAPLAEAREFGSDGDLKSSCRQAGCMAGGERGSFFSKQQTRGDTCRRDVVDVVVAAPAV